MRYGYIRCSTKEQNLDHQERALIEYGIDNIYSDYGYSGIKRDRQGLNKLLSVIAQGDTLVVTRLDRLGRSLKYLLEVVEIIRKKQANLISISEGIDTSNPMGDLVFHIFGAIAEFERNLIVERINSGIATAKSKGIKLGRKNKITPERQELLISLREQGKSISEICRLLGISESTYHKYK